MGGMCLMWRGWRTPNEQSAIYKSFPVTVFILIFVFLPGIGYSQPTDYSEIIVLNEIHYNPSAAQGSDNAFEFVELYNTAENSIPLHGIEFVQGIEHKFTSADSISGFGYLILARDSTQYQGSKQWSSGSLVNSGEALVLRDSTGSVIDSVFYGIASPWPEAPNGNGPSLELISPQSNNELPESWQSSLETGGSPGIKNAEPVVELPVMIITPDTLQFGEVAIDKQAQQQFTISNSGGDTLIIDSVSIEPDSVFQLPDQMVLPMYIAQNQSIVVDVSFIPPHSARYQASIAIQSQNSVEKTKHILLLGVGKIQQSSTLEGVLVINEIHYNPSAEQGSDSDFEFIELYNHGNMPVALQGCSFDSGIEHNFTELDTLAEHNYLILAKNSDQYAGAMQWQSGTLTNSGETIRLLDGDGLVIDEVTYQASIPWPVDANGAGSSLELVTPDLNNAEAESWQASKGVGGTPGEENSEGQQSEPTDVATVHNVPTVFKLFQNYPNPFNAGTQIKYHLPTSATISLIIYNVLGERIRTISDGQKLPAGSYLAKWQGRDDNELPVSSGVYFYRFSARQVVNNNAEFTDIGRMILLK